MHNIKIGDKDVKFVRSRGEVVYPNYVKDGLVLWYDFSGMENSGVKRGIAEDLSGNGNDGVLENFAFDVGSGYADNGLEFDGVDDRVTLTEGFVNYNYSIRTVINISNDYNKIVQDIFTIDHTNFVLRAQRVSGRLRLRLVDTRTTPVSAHSETDIELDKKYILDVISDDTSLKIYINGVVDSNTPYINKTDIVISGRAHIGYLDSNGLLSGVVDNLLIYNRALSPQEIAHNYKIDKHRFNITD